MKYAIYWASCMPCLLIPFPQELRPQLPTIVGNVDYLTLRQRLEQIDTLLREGGVERDFVQRALERWQVAAKRAVSAQEQTKFQERSRRALRCTILEALDRSSARPQCERLLSRALQAEVPALP